MRAALFCLPLAALASPLCAQVDHAAMNHSQMDHGSIDPPPVDDDIDHSAMDHSAMGHGDMAPAAQDHAEQMAAPADPHAGHAMTMPASTAASAAPAPPPPAALAGPVHAADSIWGVAAMRPVREAMATGMGGQNLSTILIDRLEAGIDNGENSFLWDMQGWIGGDLDKLWVKSEGEGAFSHGLESAEIQALWGHAIGPFFDLQLGARYDIEPVSRGYLVAGVQGLAPLMIELDAASFLSDQGDFTARIEAEYNQRLTQRLILQPRVEAEVSAQDIPAARIGAGLSNMALGLRLRYEIAREFAPYIGVSYEAATGRTADMRRADGDAPRRAAVVLGIRAWY